MHGGEIVEGKGSSLGASVVRGRFETTTASTPSRHILAPILYTLFWE